MAEAEDVMIDAARHATIFARNLWRRHHPASTTNQQVQLADAAERLGLLIIAVFGQAFPIRISQPPARLTLLQALAKRRQGPLHDHALPATDGCSIWLPRSVGLYDTVSAFARYRVLALQQAMRAVRGSAEQLTCGLTTGEREVFLLLEAAAADYALVRRLPGLRESINALRREALLLRPVPEKFPAYRRQLETLARTVLQADCGVAANGIVLAQSSALVAQQAKAITRTLAFSAQPDCILLKDTWTGELRAPTIAHGTRPVHARWNHPESHVTKPPRLGRLERRPEVREPNADEDEEKQGMFMVQTAQPNEHAEDPLGMQRPTDREEHTATDELAESLADLPEARLVTTPGRPKEILLSDDTPEFHGKRNKTNSASGAATVSYPEWDYQASAYLEPGATLRLAPAAFGQQKWVAATLFKHQAMLNTIRRRFEMLRANRVRLSRQLDGDDIDLDAYIDGYADFRAGRSMPQALYQTCRPMRRDMAISLMIDVSGSTDSWVSDDRRIIDVEREALLLVCIALDGMGEPYTVQAFSGEGPDNVSIKTIKDFDERYDNDIALRIAALEPEHYTRAGAALRHATALLMRQSAHHRLLVLLSDGKPNDIDDYEGRYGVEDMRQAVVEAQLQGVTPFCLTIDRHAAGYLSQVFGLRHYALLPKPELLPTVLLDWMKRLMTA
ncbi:VWA domain-containing protein [Janthinobacterium sp. 17J80-10]|uniref:nitric oxide reductase activation protein NorD n=1 Tax=Janthinobacterium sp. 17J80-10 TaxID=2497863 RepID=UPI0010059DB9|nr:VWA domain-containing protein [Janthinobacterium sp. 17J80-10]QAU35209.1 VWA domain-containing protein [Janthinobacterium sp. 17J80-10]